MTVFFQLVDAVAAFTLAALSPRGISFEPIKKEKVLFQQPQAPYKNNKRTSFREMDKDQKKYQPSSDDDFAEQMIVVFLSHERAKSLSLCQPQSRWVLAVTGQRPSPSTVHNQS